jgi:choline dehydrogenase-like flavoprotein
MTRSGYIKATPALLARSLALYGSRTVDTIGVRGTLSLPQDLVRREGLLNATFFIMRRPAAFASEGARSFPTLYRALRRQPRLPGLRGHVRNVARDLPQFVAGGAWIVVRGRREEGSVLMLAAQGEQSADPASRVALDDLTDAYGDPRPLLDWRIAPGDLESLRRTQDLLSERLQAAGLGTIRRRLGEESPPAMITGGFHHMGTTRMDPDPARGVVDASGRVHGIGGLFITGGSVFPTSGYANPTLTVVALAIRLADHLISEAPVATVATTKDQLVAAAAQS